MLRNGGAALIGALICFVVYFANVAIAASGTVPFLGDVPEALMLFAASCLFVAGVLGREAAEKARRRRETAS
ncbi:hypothetical protein [Amorphus coralli]|uniref:hypothetical protein n=1 Tax=Amorphus coralli TaxID=340680 RepID=UPI0003639812|nr:hypothetical protein [Amorphus coralli]